MIPTPGATRSGFCRTVPAAGPSPSVSCQTTGPRAEKLGTEPSQSIAPTATASG